MIMVVGEVYDEVTERLTGYVCIDELLRPCIINKELLVQQTSIGAVKLSTADIVKGEVVVRGVHRKNMPKQYLRGNSYIPKDEKEYKIFVVGKYPNGSYLCYCNSISTLCDEYKKGNRCLNVYNTQELIDYGRQSNIGLANVHIRDGQIVSNAGKLPDLSKDGIGYIHFTNDGYCDGLLMHYDKSILSKQGKSCPTIIYPGRFGKIKAGAFEDSKETFILSAKELSIDEKAFEGSSIQEIYGSYIYFGNSAFAYSDIQKVNCVVGIIGVEAFFGSNLKDVQLSGICDSIRAYAFTQSEIRRFKAQGVNRIWKHAFGSCGDLVYVDLGIEDCILDDGVFCQTVKLKEVHGKVVQLGKSTFYKSGIQQFDFSHVTGIPSRCFEGSAIRSIEFSGDNKQNIGEQAFYGCKKLQKIKGVVGNIGCNAFAKTGLKKISLAVYGKVETGAFEGCEELEDVSLCVSHWSTIDIGAFKDCTNLKNVTLICSAYTRNVSVERLEGVFKDCPQLKVTIKSWGNEDSCDVLINR